MQEASTLQSPLQMAELWTLDRIEAEVCAIRSGMLAAERQRLGCWAGLPETWRDSGRNLLHYLAMRRRDLRSLQEQLAARGLSSLGRAEAQALASVEAVLDVVHRLRGTVFQREREDLPAIGFARGRDLLRAHTRALLGPEPPGRDVRIMVTMPADAADDYGLVRDLLASGMDCMRINAAHDDARAWDAMLRHLERARRATGRPCRVLMDIAGPKLRTGPIEGGAPVVHWRPPRDEYGRVLRPARIWLTPREAPEVPPEPAAAVLPVARDWLSRLEDDDVVKLFDARDSMRELTVAGRRRGGVWADSQQTAYVVPGTALHLTRGRSRGVAEVGDLPSPPQAIELDAGDTLIVTRALEPGRPAVRGKRGDVLQPACVALTLPGVFDDVQPGEAIWLDDGAIGGVIRTVAADRLEVEITRAKPGGARLAADKGVNLPDSRLRLPALTDKDREDLRFIGGRADLVGYSFVRTESDVAELQAHLAASSGRGTGLVLKIETRTAFERLPGLLLAAMGSPAAGVMIARGDLAVECGYERLAEVQEEMLWMAEASHTPVIWATQVLERLAKTGIPSRAEITDAAMAERAECVMLNKGPFIVDAVRVLDDILRRMQAHQHKKSAMLRELKLAERFFQACAA
ncbi:MAG: pyruvate kinase [Acidimicrobiia bacterium]|nr:pyruvate kinase [Acidimicrobiia bacterium]